MTSRHRNASLGYIPAIDGIRAIAVLSVLVFHANNAWLPGGFVGVDIFFVISGFVVTASVSHLKFDSFSTFLTYFYARRIVRIAPALVVCLLTTAFFSTLFIPHAWLSETNTYTGLAAFFGFSNFLLSSTSDDYFSPKVEFNPYTHTWSLGVEEQFYLIFPILLYFWVRSQSGGTHRTRVKLAISLLSFASLLACSFLTTRRPEYAFYMISARFWELGTGVLLFLVIWQVLVGRDQTSIAEEFYAGRDQTSIAARVLKQAGAWSHRMATPVFLLSALCIVAALLFAQADRFPFPWALLPVAGSAGMIAMAVARPEAWFNRLLSTSWVVFIGRVSYSFYLWHWPIFVLFRWTIGLQETGYRLLAIALAFGLAVLSYRYVEQPVRQNTVIRAAPRWRVVVIGLPAIFLLALIATGTMKARHYISLSVTKDTAAWYPYAGFARSDSECAVDESFAGYENGVVQVFTPRQCPEGVHGRNSLFVLGDSHAEAYARMFRRLAAASGQEVRVFTKGGCPIVGLTEWNTPVPRECAAFLDKVTQMLSRSLARGDIVFLPSLRVQRYVDQWGDSRERKSGQDDAGPQKRDEILAEAVRTLTALHKPGVALVFEAPKPLFKSSPFRCADWFNRRNPACSGGFSLSRQELQARRQPAIEMMHAVMQSVPGVSIWDPFPVLCGGETCSAFLDGKPLFFDGDHLSGFGNDMLFGSFDAFIQQLRTQLTSVEAPDNIR